ncbi:RNA polymerase sigma factor [Elizabethkingia meningoseptica]|uniref:LuxR family transcriptional regulator n=1 Tax=Elizabethkingia meningoseptica TaxID=238 RepID=A0A1V3U4D6_ELIME|nr:MULTISPECIES: RNA polymerase sigma factor [Elizabethkingia]AQX03943.1 LuxR family transcriptional regulator [Elizabethkingia meningoseptica]AQX11406.1 LuxR family transcriptional regulator [Elizabethkingia meningoseptica]AQX45983.1 LuxR family transcriptional regulator [Elizabethkingia meningoseptica]EJK5329255.1 RNA polymerase sigma factor [Elizabethkingia meningoseptica]EOR29797.1 LuxR family transcriptional regulator [Elizabethkingia meningoseptica ATCC 13253 = NBRC 12535]
MKTENDITLLERVKRQDQQAFRILYNRYFTLLFRRVYGKIKNEDIARDILQETWIKVWEDPDFILKKDIELNAFLLKHCDYRILDYFRNLKYKMEFSEEKYPEISDDEYMEILDTLDTKELLVKIQDIIDQLTSTEKQVFELRIMNRKSVEETAKILNISEKTVRNYLSSALGEVRKQLKTHYKASRYVAAIFYIELFLNK